MFFDCYGNLEFLQNYNVKNETWLQISSELVFHITLLTILFCTVVKMSF